MFVDIVIGLVMLFLVVKIFESIRLEEIVPTLFFTAVWTILAFLLFTAIR